MKNYAKVLLENGVSFKKHQILAIKAPIESFDFVRILANEAYKMGAKYVHIEYFDDNLEYDRLNYIKDEYIGFYPEFKADFDILLAKENVAFIRLSANNFTLNIDPLKKEKANKEKQNVMKKAKFYTGYGNLNVCNARIPTFSWATKIFPNDKKALEKLWKILDEMFSSTEEWNKSIENVCKRRDFLTKKQYTKLLFKSSTCDFSLELCDNHMWSGGCEISKNNTKYMPNLPTAEIFTAPKKFSINGYVKNSKPLVVNSEIIDDFTLEFKDGKIIKAYALIGDELLKRILDTDDGSSFIGEIALVSQKSSIAKTNVLFYDTMFDENASCHMAIGKAYTCSLKDKISDNLDDFERNDLNFSSVHYDFMFGTDDLDVFAIDNSGKSIKIFEKGDFLT